MKELSREHRAILNFKTASAAVASLVRDEENIAFSRFYSAFEGALTFFIHSELMFRQADRCRALKVRPGVQSDAESAGERLNRRGIEMLTISQAMLASFGKGLGEEPVPDPTLQTKLAEFRTEAREALADLELKASDVRELDGALSEAIAAAGPGKTSKDLVAFMTKKLKDLAALRATEGRGAETNIAIWKIVAAAILLVLSVWTVVKCYRTNWGCSQKEQEIYGTVLAVALMTFGACE